MQARGPQGSPEAGEEDQSGRLHLHGSLWTRTVWESGKQDVTRVSCSTGKTADLVVFPALVFEIPFIHTSPKAPWKIPCPTENGQSQW